MHARMVTTSMPSGKGDEEARIYREMVDGARDVEGFLGALLLTDGEGGKSVSITLWESEQAMLHTEESGWWQAQIDKFKHVMEGAPQREHFKVEVAGWPEAGREKSTQGDTSDVSGLSDVPPPP